MAFMSAAGEASCQCDSYWRGIRLTAVIKEIEGESSISSGSELAILWAAVGYVSLQGLHCPPCQQPVGQGP